MNGKEKRLQKQKELRDKADSLKSEVYQEIMAYKPMGKMGEFAEVMGGLLKRGVAYGTPIGTMVFAKNRAPTSEQLKSWEKRFNDASELKALDLEWSISDNPIINHTIGNYRVVEQGKKLFQEGLLDDSEIKTFKIMEKFWDDHSELDKDKDSGCWEENMNLRVCHPTYKERKELWSKK